MGMKAAKEIAERMRGILTRDKIGVKDGFLSALKGDVNRLLYDYFELDAPAELEIRQGDDGDYEVSVKARATRIKSFESTADIKRI